VRWPDNAEVSAVDRRDFGEREPLGCRYDRCVDGPKRQIAVRGHELGDAQPVSGQNGLDRECAGGEVAEEADLGFDAEAGGEEIRDLRHHENGHDQRAEVRLQELERLLVMRVVGVDVGVERAGVDDDPGYRRTSAARISSMRSDTSVRPLRPAFAAPRRRRPGGPTRYASSASRLMSEMVTPRRWASCRRRASKDSGIFTVVRRMYASIPSHPAGSAPSARRGIITIMETSAGRAVPDPFRQAANLWWLWLILGVFWIVVALVVLQFDQASITTVGVLIGIMFLVAGVQNFIFGSLAGGAMQWILWIFAVLFVIAGVISLISPEDTFAGIADILGFLFLMVGIYWLLEAFTERATNELWWFSLIAGIAMIIVAFWTGGQFFIDKQYVLLVFAGIWALFHGVGDLIRAFQIRKLRDLMS
jgi:uncharacterized membrane protein HdeD (DUF308 family)